jgi:hypothetical protein
LSNAIGTPAKHTEGVFRHIRTYRAIPQPGIAIDGSLDQRLLHIMKETRNSIQTTMAMRCSQRKEKVAGCPVRQYDLIAPRPLQEPRPLTNASQSMQALALRASTIKLRCDQQGHCYSDAVRTINISDLKAQLSAHIQLVRDDEEVLVFDRNQPVARIVFVVLAQWEGSSSNALRV